MVSFRIIVRLDTWEADSQYPNGHFVRSLGPIGSLETEIAAILVENNISVGAFSEGQVSSLKGFIYFLYQDLFPKTCNGKKRICEISVETRKYTKSFFLFLFPLFW